MRTKVFDKVIAVRLDVGDELFESLKYTCKKHEIKAGIVNGIGASKNAVIGVYNIEEQKYHPVVVEEFCEIASLTGNISTMNGENYLHLHAVLGGESGKVYAGHLQSAVIGATAEIFITPLEGEIERIHDKTIGINVFEI